MISDLSEGVRRKLAFLFSGGCGFLVYYAASLLLVRIPGIGVGMASFCGMLVAVFPAFLLQRKLAFRYQGSLSRSFVGYCALQVANAACLAWVARVGHRLGLADEINFAVSAALVVVFSYLVLSRVVFKTGSIPVDGRKSLNAQYNLAAAGGLTDRISTMMRRKMYACFAVRVDARDRILDVGVTSDREQMASNYLEAWHPWKERITACGIDDASFLEKMYPGMAFVQADGRNLPFDSGSFDWVHSSAVLEHVGSREEQVRFVSELYRVSRKGIFLTTPNRWFPVEFHSVWPLAHWLPAAWFRRLLRLAGHHELALEKNLNLLGRNDLDDIARAAGVEQREVRHVALGGWPSNLILVARKQESGEDQG